MHQRPKFIQYQAIGMSKRIFLSRQLADDSNINIQELSCRMSTLEHVSSQQLRFAQRQRSRQKDLCMGSLHGKSSGQQKNNDKYMQQSLASKCNSIMQGDESSKNFMKQKPVSRHLSRTQSRIDMKMTKRKNWLQLKDVVTHQKVQNLAQIFVDKLKRNNPFSPPVDHQLEDDSQFSFLDRKGLELKESVQKIINIVSIFNIVCAIFMYTLGLVFQQINHSYFIQFAQIFGGVLFSIEIVLNLITVRFSQGCKIQTLRQISKDYIEHKFYIDLLNFIVILININTSASSIDCLNLIVILKLSDCMQKLQKLQVHFIQNYYNEQYWSLIKVFMFNFGFAHFLAIIMIGMSDIDTSNNWMVTRHIDESAWFQKYTWAYYWATTMMLTIGFGDIVPVTYKEALCMIFLQTISCIVLAYNINCVGGLVANIRSQDIEKSKNLKIFKKLADKHKISQSLTWKVNNYIEEHTNIHKLFNIEQQAQFVQKLPAAYRVDYLKQANRIIFQKLFFFSHMMQKTLFALAEVIEVRITHPQQLILNAQTNLDLLILKKGEIGYISRLLGRDYNKFIFDRIVMKDSGQPYLLHTNFITKKRAEYGIKSIVYSVIYQLDFQSLINILKEHKLDYELYCQMKDKGSIKLDEYQVFICEYCKTKHTKFSCPKLHYMPLGQHVIYRELSKQKNGRNKRVRSFERPMLSKQSCLTNYVFNKEIYVQKREQEQQYVQALNKKLRKEKFLIEELKAVDNQTEEEFARQKIEKNKRQMEDMAKVQSKFLQSTSQLIKIYISKAFGIETGEDEMWLIDLDRMKNYKDYFNADNPCNLEKKFDLEQRMAVIAEKQNYDALTTAFLGTQHDIYDERQNDSKNQSRQQSALNLEEIGVKAAQLLDHIGKGIIAQK